MSRFWRRFCTDGFCLCRRTVVNVQALVQRHQAAIAAAVQATCARWRLVGTDADDLGQELWVRVLRDDARVLRDFEGRSKIATYLFCVMNRGASRWIRKRAVYRRREPTGGDTYQTYSSSSCGTLVSRVRGVDGQEIRTLPLAIAGNPVDIAIVEMRRRGYSHSEIARCVGLTVKGAQHRFYRAIRRIRQRSPPNARQRMKLARPPSIMILALL